MNAYYIFERIGGKWSALRACYRLSNVMDANEDGEEIVLDSDTDEPAADYKKEELLRLRSGSLLSDYVSKMK